MLNLAKGFLARGREVDIVLCQAKGALLDEIPAGATMIELEATGGFGRGGSSPKVILQDFFARLRPVLLAKKIAPEVARIQSLQTYIADSRPDVILSALPYANLCAIWAKELSGSRVPVIVSERIALSTHCAAPSNFSQMAMALFARASPANLPKSGSCYSRIRSCGQ